MREKLQKMVHTDENCFSFQQGSKGRSISPFGSWNYADDHAGVLRRREARLYPHHPPHFSHYSNEPLGYNFHDHRFAFCSSQKVSSWMFLSPFLDCYYNTWNCRWGDLRRRRRRRARRWNLKVTLEQRAPAAVQSMKISTKSPLNFSTTSPERYSETLSLSFKVFSYFLFL